MSQQEIDDNFSIEMKRHKEFFLPYYQERNWQVVEDKVGANQKEPWDVKLEIRAGEFRTVDEKAWTRDGGGTVRLG